MKDKSPLENLFDEMGELLKLVNDGIAKGVNEENVPLDIEKRLDKLEEDVEEFARMGREIVASSGLSSAEMRKYQDNMAEEISPEGKELIDKVKQLQQQAEDLEASYKTGIMPPSETSEKKGADDLEYGKHRRKKFKRFGSDSKWKPL